MTTPKTPNPAAPQVAPHLGGPESEALAIVPAGEGLFSVVLLTVVGDRVIRRRVVYEPTTRAVAMEAYRTEAGHQILKVGGGI